MITPFIVYLVLQLTPSELTLYLELQLFSVLSLQPILQFPLEFTGQLSSQLLSVLQLTLKVSASTLTVTFIPIKGLRSFNCNISGEAQLTYNLTKSFLFAEFDFLLVFYNTNIVFVCLGRCSGSNIKD